jgi:uncharacterized protein (TIGR02231 family)
VTEPRAPIELTAAPARVTVYEDRAEVVREAIVTLPAGSAVVVVRDLPAVLSDEHVVARLAPLPEEGGGGEAHVNDVRVDRRVVGPGAGGGVGGHDEVSARSAAMHEALKILEDELRAAEEAARRVNAEKAATEIALRRFTEQLARAAGAGEGDREAWAAGARAFEEKLVACDRRRAEARAAIAEVRRRRERALGTAPLDRSGRKPTGQRTVADLRLRVSGAGGRFRLIVSTLVPCAAWRPTHEARLVTGASEKIDFVSAAAVWNRTGEPWIGVALTLSTARPSAGAELPPLRADRLTLRQKTAEERRTIVVEHRDEGVPKKATQGAAPGVDDGGQTRAFLVASADVPDDGRPHRVEVSRFEVPCFTARVAFPEVLPQVFLRASLKNQGPGPILAGPVTLIVDGMWVGTGDVLYVGPGESFDLGFGTDDRFLVRTKRRRAEDKKLVAKDVVHFIREAILSHTGSTTEKVLVHLRLPVSEVKQLRVLPSPQHTTIDTSAEARPDEHGVIRVSVELPPNVEKKLVLAFSFDASGDVQIPDPW